VDLVCLAGYLRRFRVDAWQGRALNIHPALLPEFGGHGMFGERVHRAVIAAGRTESGCTVHWVDAQYDHGQHVVQRRCPVLPGDTPETLADRVWAEETLAYPEAIRQLDEHLEHWPQILIHKCKQRLTKMTQYLIRMRRMRLKPRPTLERVHKKVRELHTLMPSELQVVMLRPSDDRATARTSRACWSASSRARSARPRSPLLTRAPRRAWSSHARSIRPRR
jgi:hypothetical protein